ARYYEGEQVVQMLNISIPPALQSRETVVGWPGTTVDVLEERLDWYGWASDADDFALGDDYNAHHRDVNGSLAHTDALIYGTSFAVVGAGFDGEPDPLVTMHSPRAMTGIYSGRTRRLTDALSVTYDNGQATEVALYRTDQTVYLSR